MEKEKTSASFRAGKVLGALQALKKLEALRDKYERDGNLDAVTVLDEAIKLIPIRRKA